MTRKLYEIAADIIEAQAEIGPMTPEALEQALSTVFVTLQRMKIAEDGGFLLDQAKPSEEPVQEGVPVDPKSSIQEDKVICLECSKEMRQLTAKHLGSHGLTIREYKKNGFSSEAITFSIIAIKSPQQSRQETGAPREAVEVPGTTKAGESGCVGSCMFTHAATKAPAKKRAKTNAPAKKRAKKKAE